MKRLAARALTLVADVLGFASDWTGSFAEYLDTAARHFYWPADSELLPDEVERNYWVDSDDYLAVHEAMSR